MAIVLFAASALLLSLERITYVWIWRHPTEFRQLVDAGTRVGGDPVGAVRRLFLGFKVIQASVFLGWCLMFGGGRLLADPIPAALAAGAVLTVGGQALNVTVFYRLGVSGVFYGSRFGLAIPWSQAFPFSWLRHPQYVGTVLSIWGLFLVLRFPEPDWCVLPLLETAYYALGARLEQSRTPARPAPAGRVHEEAS